MLIKGSETCDAHISRITGERMGSIEADNSPPTRIIEENTKTDNQQDTKKIDQNHRSASRTLTKS